MLFSKASSNLLVYMEYKAWCIDVKKNPIIDIKKTSSELGLVFNTVSKAVNNLMDIGILKQTQNASRNRCFAYEEYLAILRKDT